MTTNGDDARAPTASETAIRNHYPEYDARRIAEDRKFHELDVGSDISLALQITLAAELGFPLDPKWDQYRKAAP